MISLIPAPYRVAAAGIAALLAFCGGIVGGALLASRHFEPALAAAHHRAGELEHAYLTLATATARQNTALEQLHAEGIARRENAILAAASARGAAQHHYDNSKAVLGLKPPPGADPCHAARDAFDAELRRERAQP